MVRVRIATFLINHMYLILHIVEDISRLYRNSISSKRITLTIIVLVLSIVLYYYVNTGFHRNSGCLPVDLSPKSCRAIGVPVIKKAGFKAKRAEVSNSALLNPCSVLIRTTYSSRYPGVQTRQTYRGFPDRNHEPYW
jgi:hypothetical protein